MSTTSRPVSSHIEIDASTALSGEFRAFIVRCARTKMVPTMPEPQIPDATLQGSVLVLLQFDVCEAIRLDQLRTLLQARIADPPGLKHPAQGNVRYQRPPIIEPLDPLILESG